MTDDYLANYEKEYEAIYGTGADDNNQNSYGNNNSNQNQQSYGGNSNQNQ